MLVQNLMLLSAIRTGSLRHMYCSVEDATALAECIAKDITKRSKARLSHTVLNKDAGQQCTSLLVLRRR